MKKLIQVSAVFLAVCVMAMPSAFAVNSSTFTISATVASGASISVAPFKNTVAAGNELTGTSFSFGTLVDDAPANGTLRSSTTGGGNSSIIFLITGGNAGSAYTIRSTGTALTSGANTIPTGATTIVPVDNPGQGALVGTLGTAGTWVATGKTLYTSNAAGVQRTIQAHISVTDDPAAGFVAPAVTTGQASGTYSGTIFFTVA